VKISASSKILSGICVLILCFVLLPTNVFGQESPASPEESITITYDFPEPRVDENREIPPPKGTLPVTEGYVSVTMEGLPQWSEPGLPVLPFKTARVLLPYGSEVEHITVTGGNRVALPGSYVVEPGQEAVPLSHEGPVEVTPPDPDVYDSPASFPGKLYSGDTIQSKSGYRILLLNIYPVEYIPEEGQLSYYESLTAEITLKAAAAEVEWQHVRYLAQDEDLVKEMVDNPEATMSYHVASHSSEKSSLLDPDDYEYVIITDAALKATPGPYNFQALMDEKISRGITAAIVTTEWIYANYAGTRPDGGEDNQTKIRNFIIDAYDTWGTKYVLLGGDGDGADVGGESGDDIIPHRGFAVLDVVGESDIPADMYYACLDGTFDYDANGIYGEPNDGPGGGEVDLFAEVYVGRASVDSVTEVQNFVNKTLAYHNMPMTDENLRKVWMTGEYLGFGGVADWGGNYKDEIKEGSGAHGYTTVGFENSPYAPGFDMSTLYDRDYPGNYWPPSEIIDVINDNPHLINHLGHANVDYVMKIYNSDVDTLTNSELYFIGYSQGCYSGSFDNRDVYGDYMDYDCIAEQLTTQPHGAVAFIANSRYGIGEGYSTDGPSQHYDREFWDAVLGENIPNIGVANQDSKEDNAGRISNAEDRWCYYTINLFGDPELTLKLYEGVTYDSHEIDDSAGGDNDGYPEPGESISMPVTLRNTSTSTTFSDVSATLSAICVDEEVLFADDIEAGQDGWTCDGLWHLTEHRSYSATHSWYYGIEDVWNYDTGGINSGSVVSPPIDLTGLSGASLTFSYWYETESQGSTFDQRRVLISVDGGFPEPLEQLSGDDMNTWQQHTTDLSSYVGHSVQIMFSFDTIDEVANDYEGWYVDDVTVTGFVPVSDPYITITDDYEEYGDILPSNIAASLGAYDFTIDAECPVGHVATFILDITASNCGPWAATFDVRVEGPDLVITDKWEEWVDEEAGTYTVHYVVKNQANVAAPAGHETALTVDGAPLETKPVPVELGPGEEYEGAFDTIVALSEDFDGVTVCADIYDVIEELSEVNNCRSNTVLQWTDFITDPTGDQFYGYGPDAVGVDFYRDDTTIYFRVRTAEPIDPDDTVDYMFLDLDLDASTGFVSPYPEIPTNDIGADAAALIYPAGGYGMTGEQWSLPLGAGGDKLQLGTSSPQALSPGLQGELWLWDPDYGDFYSVGDFPVFTDTDYFWFAVPLGILGDDGIMSVVNVIGSYYYGELTDVAPNEGHGTTGEGLDLIIADKWEEWVNEEEGTYTVHYVVKNQGNVAVPAGHETALTVDYVQIETETVPVELGPGEEYEGAFDTIVALSEDFDEVTVCADIYDVIEELSEGNNCRSNTVLQWTEFITDATGDQFYGYGPDIVGADFYRDDTTIYFRVRTAEPIDPNDTGNMMFLDLDQNPSTGYVSGDPYIPTNDIGADAYAGIFPGYYGTMGEGWSLPPRTAGDERQLEMDSPGTLSLGLQGELYLWNPDYEWFDYVGSLLVLTDTNYFWFAIPLDMLDDDGIMSVVHVIGSSYEPTDVAPDEGHGVTGEGPDLVIADKWEEWVDEEEGTYAVHYIVKNQGTVAVPAGHETVLTVDGAPLETKAVPVELVPGQQYQDSFDTIVPLSPPDEITVCADYYDDVMDELSEENNCLTNMLFMDVVRLTTEPDYDESPAITQTSDGTVWVAWERWGDTWYRTSPDGGITWSGSSIIDLDMWCDHPAIAQTSDGTIWVTFYCYESGNTDIWYTTSSDGGATWSVPSQITTDPDSDYDPAITQTDDGTIWVAWYSYRSSNPDIWYKTSADGGESWSPDYQLTTDPDSDYDPAIIQTDDGTVWMVWQSYRSGGNGIWYKTSSNGGETWSGDSPIDLGGIWGYSPAIAQTGDGKIWVTFYSYQSGNSDIWYITSSDAGASWSAASQFTRFVGDDREPAVTALASGQLALAWMSERYTNYDIWYGVIGLMEDINPPPYLYWAENEPLGPDTTDTVTIRASVGDESGIEDVQLVWWVDGEPQDMLPMYDDGAHDDYGAGDGVYGVQIGPFPVVGTYVEYQLQITDIDSNTILVPYTYSFEVVEPFVKTADILLVADEAYDYTEYYTEALDNTEYPYDIWETWLRGNIDGETLNQYFDGVVIWAVPYGGYIDYGETWDNLSSYLDNGGKLFISGQDVGLSIGGSWFYQEYLHAQYVQDNIGLYCLDGVPSDPISDGLYVCISGGDGANNQAWPSEIDPIWPAETIFFYDPEATAPLSPLDEPKTVMDREASDRHQEQKRPGTTIIESSGTGALRVDTGVYKVVYFAFGFEAINSVDDRATVMGRVLDWLGVPPPEDWQIPMSISADIGSAEVAFGANSLATDGYDEDYDCPAPPSPPEGVDAYFYYPDNPEFQRKLATSIVAPADSIIWPLKVMYKTEFSTQLVGPEVTISWSPEDIAEVPDYYLTLILTDDTGQELANLRTDPRYKFQAEPDALHSFYIKASRLACLELKAGWNMVSLPLEPETTDPDEIFPGAAAIYTWNNAGKHYDKATEILPCKGYYVLYFEDVTLCFGGTGIYEYGLSGGSGWHMIGGLSVEAEVVVNSGDVYGTLYHWDPETMSYIGRPLDDVRPGEGYWLLAFSEFSISVVPKPPVP
jgi:archaellum component FlaG (FlaF/FlaG flagellin family)